MKKTWTGWIGKRTKLKDVFEWCDEGGEDVTLYVGDIHGVYKFLNSEFTERKIKITVEDVKGE